MGEAPGGFGGGVGGGGGLLPPPACEVCVGLCDVV